MKIDLHKVYNYVDLSFLRMILIKISLLRENVCYNMTCVVYVNYSILINGFPSGFFQAERGLRQDCSLSPLLFILVMVGLRRNIWEANTWGIFHGMQVTQFVSTSHSFFVDDILTLGKVYWEQWYALRHIFTIFGANFCLYLNGSKSLLIHSFGDLEVIQNIATWFGVPVSHVEDGFTYLGFKWKPFNYKNVDQFWLLEKF